MDYFANFIISINQILLFTNKGEKNAASYIGQIC